VLVDDAARFEFNGAALTVINNHLSSRFGSTPVFGAIQPFFQAAETEREAQTGALNDYVDHLLSQDGEARVVVLGDFNTFEFTDDLTEILPGKGKKILFNLLEGVRDDNRYSYIFEGNSQVLDHIFVTRNMTAQTELDIVHVNVDFPRVDESVASDHEPLVTRLRLD
jgi:predicted extracellular nuclease